MVTDVLVVIVTKCISGKQRKSWVSPSNNTQLTQFPTSRQFTNITSLQVIVWTRTMSLLYVGRKKNCTQESERGHLYQERPFNPTLNRDRGRELSRLYDSMILYWQHLVVIGHHHHPEVENQMSVNTQFPSADDRDGFSENFGTQKCKC